MTPCLGHAMSYVEPRASGIPGKHFITHQPFLLPLWCVPSHQEPTETLPLFCLLGTSHSGEIKQVIQRHQLH
ncbi:rCG63496 [Rattus norvegicus]|uniref:RCG63496 n=1 Tax=Rattus norvegicus TaxID=10116 RepID=A6HCS7_RAT|nr:rCG63496 [Rattus norvegicus]